MVAATARQRWLVGMENQIIELGVDGFLGCMEKAEGNLLRLFDLVLRYLVTTGLGSRRW
jgi:hypothetical protein